MYRTRKVEKITFTLKVINTLSFNRYHCYGRLIILSAEIRMLSDNILSAFQIIDEWNYLFPIQSGDFIGGDSGLYASPYG